MWQIIYFSYKIIPLFFYFIFYDKKYSSFSDRGLWYDH